MDNYAKIQMKKLIFTLTLALTTLFELLHAHSNTAVANATMRVKNSFFIIIFA